MITSANQRTAVAAPSLGREFLFQQVPLIVTVLMAGLLCSLVQHGGVSVDPSFIRLIWLGVWTGYALALVGQAAGLFALPYSTDVMGFNSVAVSPTIQLMTLVNPLGALLAQRSSGEWNLGNSRWICFGACVGGAAGPLLRVRAFQDQAMFDLLLGVCLVGIGCQLLWEGMRGPRAVADQNDPGRMPPATTMFMLGAAVGTLSVALGVGGGFLLVPVLCLYFRLPLRLVSTITIPYTIVLSAVGLVGYLALLPMAGQPSVHPDWAWGLYAGAGGILGSWCAVKTQHLYPDRLLRFGLGAALTLIGLERAF